MKRDWEGAAKKDHFSDQSVGLEILSDSFIPVQGVGDGLAATLSRLSAFTRPGCFAFVPYNSCLLLHFFLDWLHGSGGLKPLKHIKGFKDLWFGKVGGVNSDSIRSGAFKGRWGQ